jgi:signal transduction histidine kinase
MRPAVSASSISSWLLRGLVLLACTVVACTPGTATAQGTGQPRADTHTEPNRIALTRVEFLERYHEESPPPVSEPGRVIEGIVSVSGPNDADRRLRWFRAKVHLATAPTRPQALYVPFVSRNLRVFVNGAEVSAGDVGNVPTDLAWNYPHLFLIPAALLHEGRNDLLMQIVPKANGTAILHPATFADEELLQPGFERELRQRVLGPQIVSLMLLLAGAMSLLVWWRRRTESVFLWFGVACLIWVVRNAHFYVREAWVSLRLFAVISEAALHWLFVALLIFAFRLCGERHPRVERAALAFAMLATIAMLVVPTAHLWSVIEASLLPLPVIALGVTVYVVLRALRSGRIDLWLLGIACIVNAAFGAADMAQLMGVFGERWHTYLMPYGALFFMLVLGWALIDRFIRAIADIEQVNRSLEGRLQDREREIADKMSRISQLERSQAIATERQRIVQDMHDGLGSTLISSLHLVESGAASMPQVAALLRECVDDLRLAIDSLKPQGDDLLLLLANLRFRMDQRLRSAGIDLIWRVDSNAAAPALAPENVLQILRIVQEAIANTLKHAKASSRITDAVSTWPRRRRASGLLA